jgi:hypothetical protein
MTNDDVMPVATLIANKVRGFYENQGTVEFTIQYQNTGKDSSITYTICEDNLNGCSSSTSIGELDHTLTTGTINITGSTTQTLIDNDVDGVNDINLNTVTFSIVDDALAEGEETIVVKISSSDFDFDSLATITPTSNYDTHTFYIFPSDRPQMALGDNFGCSLTNGMVKCWGQNAILGLGIDSTTGGGYYGNVGSETISNQTAVDLGSNFTPIKIAAGSNHICALSSAGYVKCWGNDQYGKTGMGVGGSTSYTGDATNEMGDYLTIVPIGEQVQDIALGLHHTCALTISGQVKCWGLNNATTADGGPLGYDSTTSQACVGNEEDDNCKGDYPGEIAASGFVSLGANKTAYKIAASDYQTCVYLYDSSSYESSVECFGDGISGVQRLIDLAEVTSSVESSVEYIEIKNLIGSPFGTMCAVYTVESTDDLQCWNADVTSISDITPNLSTVSALSVADNDVLCIYDAVTHPAKTARCGTTNLNTTIYNDAQASVTYDFYETYLGQDFACAATGTSSLACWGENSFGQLAVGTSVDNGTISNPNSVINFQPF